MILNIAFMETPTAKVPKLANQYSYSPSKGTGARKRTSSTTSP
jgi:hypothetical protein